MKRAKKKRPKYIKSEAQKQRDRKSEAARKLENEFYKMWVGDYYYKR